MNISSTENVMLQETRAAKIVPFKSPNGLQDPNGEEAVKNEKTVELRPELSPKKTDKDQAELTQDVLDEIAQDLETLHSVGLNFSKHKASGRTMVKVMNRETDELIREIPAENVLNLAAKMDEMIGLLFDKKV
jgi:flagellar protein FlaG